VSSPRQPLLPPKRRLRSPDFDNPQLHYRPFPFSRGKICGSIGAGSWSRNHSGFMRSSGGGSRNVLRDTVLLLDQQAVFRLVMPKSLLLVIWSFREGAVW
jgi:hypothetical protein